jgi:hypothetical protein
MVTLNTHIKFLDGVAVLNSIRRARDNELPMYRERFLARVPDPGDMLRHSTLSHIAFLVVQPPSAFTDAWSALRQLGKSGVYSNEDVDKQIGIMLSELAEIEAEVNRFLQSKR